VIWLDWLRINGMVLSDLSRCWPILGAKHLRWREMQLTIADIAYT
jgi:hypothetical protein